MADDRYLGLSLCIRCKGLFPSHQQCVIHIDICDGDAYKSPAQLFACERKFFLETSFRGADLLLDIVGEVTSQQEQVDYNESRKRKRLNVSESGVRDLASDIAGYPCDRSHVDITPEVCRDTLQTSPQTTGSCYGSDATSSLSQEECLSDSFVDKLQPNDYLNTEHIVPDSDTGATCASPTGTTITSETSSFELDCDITSLSPSVDFASGIGNNSKGITHSSCSTSQQNRTETGSVDASGHTVVADPDGKNSATALLAYLHNLHQGSSDKKDTSAETQSVNTELSESSQSYSSDLIESCVSDSSSVKGHATFLSPNTDSSCYDSSNIAASSSENEKPVSSDTSSFEQDLLGAAVQQTLFQKNTVIAMPEDDIFPLNLASAPARVSQDGSLTIQPGLALVETNLNTLQANVSKKNTKPSAAEKKAKLESLKQEIMQQCTVIPAGSSSEKARFRCGLCGHSTASVAFMHKHLQSHNGGAKFHCDYCSFTCLQRSRMAEHQARHTRPKLLCQHCSATFSDTSSLNRHIASKHSENPALKCNQCDFVASDPTSLTEHVRKHTGEKLQCSFEGCSFQTAYLRALRLHEKRHTADKKFECHICQFRCIEANVLTRHMRKHQTTKPFQCASCSFTGNTKYEVIRHMQRKHDERKRYACDKCSFRTPYPNSIIKHVIAHMGSEAAIFACPLCELRSNSHARAKKHLHKVHEREDLDVIILQKPVKVNPMDYISKEPPVEDSLAESRTIDEVMAGRCVSVESECMSSSPPGGLEGSRIDPMKLSFHFHDIPPPPGNSGVSITRSSSIPDLFTFSGMTAGHRSNSQSDLFSGINITRSNSMSDLVSFATSMCAESSEPVNMDVSLSDAQAPTTDVHGLSLGDGTEVSLSDGVRPGSPGGVVLAVQCPNCLALLMNEEDVDSHNKSCTGVVQMV